MTTIAYGISWRSWIAGTLVAGALASCGTGSGPTPVPTPIQPGVSLAAFSGANACQDLEKYIEDEAVLQMRTQIEGERDGVGCWGWWGCRLGIAYANDAAGAPRAADSAPAPAPSAYTTTNVQVAGVDEADFVKNDGTRIFSLTGNTLYAVKSWPAVDMAIQSKTTIEGYPREMFLDDKNHVVVFSSVYGRYPLDSSACVDGTNDKSGFGCGYGYGNTVKVTVLDVGDLTNLKLVSEYYLAGSYLSARRIGSSVRLVLNDSFRYPKDMAWWPEWQPPYNVQPSKAAYDQLIAKNELLIRAQSLSDWLPEGKQTVNGSTSAIATDCSSFSKVNAPTRLGHVGVVTLNLDKNTISQSNIIAESDEIYASAQNLYVATRHWWWWPMPGQDDATYIHMFDISNPDAATYVASGVAPGNIVDQFSMDEQQKNGQTYFRIASTVDKRVVDTQNPKNEWGTIVTTNLVSVLQKNGGKLDVVGTSAELAKGERITSSRFFGDKGYVVTYRQIDPLFTFDLSDPTKPTQVGELKVPGFSTYLHALDDNHLLTIGRYTSSNPNPWESVQGVQLAIYDVSDLKSPKQTFTQLVGSGEWNWSEAGWDHKAFNYFKEKGLLAIPYSEYNYGNAGTWYWGAFVSDLRVFSVDPVTGFVPKGSVAFNDMYQYYASGSGNYYWSYYWSPQIRRSVMADDFVYAISDAGIRVAQLPNLGTPLATVHFDPITFL